MQRQEAGDLKFRITIEDIQINKLDRWKIEEKFTTRRYTVYEEKSLLSLVKDIRKGNLINWTTCVGRIVARLRELVSTSNSPSRHKVIVTVDEIFESSIPEHSRIDLAAKNIHFRFEKIHIYSANNDYTISDFGSIEY